MVSLTDVLIVTLIAIGTAILVGVLGYLIDKNSEPSERHRQ